VKKYGIRRRVKGEREGETGSEYVHAGNECSDRLDHNIYDLQVAIFSASLHCDTTRETAE